MDSNIEESKNQSPSPMQQMPSVHPFATTICSSFQYGLSFVKNLLSYWTTIIFLSITLFHLLGHTVFSELLKYDEQERRRYDKLVYITKLILVYGLGWMVVAAVHQRYGNDYMKMLKARNREGFKRLFFFNIKLGFFLQAVLFTPCNPIAVKFTGILLLYFVLSQEYVQIALKFTIYSLTKKHMQFVCNFTCNQATSLSFFMTPLADIILPILAGPATFLPICVRFTQCWIVGTFEQYLNAIKFTLNMISAGYLIFGMPVQSYWWRVAASLYSFYWDIWRDFKWPQRFIQRKSYRIDLPAFWFIIVLIYDIFGRTVWIFVPMSFQTRGYVEVTRRLMWDIARLEREQVYYHPKPKSNNVKDLNPKEWYID